LYGALYGLSEVIFLQTNNKIYSHLADEKPITTTRSKIASVVGYVVATSGWLYWFTAFSIYWNFVSYLLSIGLILTGVPLFFALRNAAPEDKKSIKIRHFKASGYLLLVITLSLFPNVPRLFQQVPIHLNANQYVITPNHPSVQKLTNVFLKETPNFNDLDFLDQMNAVDEFVKKEIKWVPDLNQYGMIGLLTSPDEVISRMAGDCQGQAATTASMLMALGFPAYVVETPFHWWTHAVDPETGQVHNLNVHGHAEEAGNVLPQPIDLIYTNPPAEPCPSGEKTCPDMFRHNKNSMYYAAPPHLAIMIAFTGGHIFVRSGMTLDAVSFAQVFLMGSVLGLAFALYASYVQNDSNYKRFISRLLITVPVAVGPICFGMVCWATYAYQFTLLHLVFTITYMIVYTSDDEFNNMLKNKF